MSPICPICEQPFVEGDEIQATVVAIFKEIPSKRCYAINSITDCIEMLHLECVEEYEC